MSAELIPFGKYKGQPVEILENDPQYAEWLAQQAWAKERYPQIVNVIINKFGNDEETPEHNAMQAKFMSKGYCALLAERLGAFSFDKEPPEWTHRNGCYRNEVINPICTRQGSRYIEIDHVEKLSDAISGIEFEKDAIDVQFTVMEIGLALRCSAEIPGNFRNPWGGESGRINWIKQEQESSFSTRRRHCRAELKPVVGDDYPAVLRQMRNNGSNTLVYGTYSGHGVDEATFREFMKSQGLRVVKESEITASASERAEAAVSEINSRIASWLKKMGSRPVDYSGDLFCPIPPTET